MRIKKYHVDAFADHIFQGNPAAVCLLDEFLTDEKMINMAAEHNLAETAFVVHNGDHYLIRWFTPTIEVQLCGHATLAAAFVIFNYTSFESDVIHFKTRDVGSLFVRQDQDLLLMDFPADPPVLVSGYSANDFGVCNDIYSILKGKTKYVVVLNTEEEVKNLSPDLNTLTKLKLEGVIFTAKSGTYDFVSRFFCPKIGIDEDPVTGSAHTVLAPYWADQLQKNKLVGRQVSDRAGTVRCELNGDRVMLSGKAKLYSEGEILLDNIL